LKTSWQAKTIRKTVENIEAVTPPWGWPNYVLGNHDEPRIAGKLGPIKARQAAMLLLTLRGTPTIYNGDEFGQTNVPISPENEIDPWGKRVPGAGRDPCRTPLQWNAGPNAGFTTEGITPWLPIAENHQIINMETELEDPQTMLNLYRKLLTFRRLSPALHSGRQASIDPVPDNCFAFIRELDNEKIINVFNFGKAQEYVNLHRFGNLEIIVSTGMNRSGKTDASNVEISPAEGLVLRVV
jgi:alpha-glucosidase